MSKLEQTILRVANQELTAIECGFREAATLAFQNVMAFVMLAHMKDSGLSEDAIKQLLNIENKAALALSAFPELTPKQ